MRIVILDDSKTVRLTIQARLEEFGAEEKDIFLFEEGEKALEDIINNGADIIFSDIQMPGMDGFEFVDKLFHHSEHYAANLFIVSAEERSHDIEKMKSLGVKHFLRKPIDTVRFTHFIKPRIIKYKGVTDSDHEVKPLEISAIDYDALAREMGVKPKHIPMLIKSFLDESSVLLEKLEQAIKEKNYPDIAKFVHSLKGSAGNMKFNDVYEMGKMMESAANESDKEFDYEHYCSAMKKGIDTLR